MKIATAFMLAFGIMAQILSEMMGYTPMLQEYFFYLLPSVAAGFLAYWMVTKLRKGGKISKAILTIVLIIILAWSPWMIWGFVYVQFDSYYQDEVYGNGWYIGWANLKEEVQYMLSKCRLFGHGEAYFWYLDELIDPAVRILDDLPQDVQNAMMERDRAKIFR